MIDRISTGLSQTQPSRSPDASGEAEGGLAAKFAERLEKTSELVEKAEANAAAMSRGEAGSVETILALSRAELALRHVVSVRNRAIEAYQEIMRLPV